MSSPPTKYVKSTDYAATPALNVDFDRIVSTTGQTIDRLAEIQRDDGKLKDSAITTNSLADGSVTEPKLATASVSTRALQDGSVTGPKLAPGSIPPAAILPNSIGSAQLLDGGIQTVDLADLSVTQQKLSLLSVGTPQLIDAAVTPAKLAPATISAFAPALHTHPESDVVNLIADLALKAPLASPALTGVPTAPTAAVGTATTQLATTQFVSASLSSVGSITEAPNDGALYGRQALGWQLGVKLAGDVMTGPLQVPLLRLGGATNLFAGLKSTAAVLKARLADDSADAAFTSADHAPGTNILSSLGTAALRWLKLWAKDGDFSGDLTVAGNITGNLPGVPGRNLIINGDMRVDQHLRGLAGVMNAAQANSWGPDRFNCYCRVTSGAIAASVQAYQAGAPYPWALRYLVTTGGVLPDPTDYTGVGYTIEGYDMTELWWGTPQAKPLTISFNAYCNIAGTFGLTLRNFDASRMYVATYALPAGVWTKVTVTIPPDTAGVWKVNNERGVFLLWDLGCGANQTNPFTGAWIAGNGKLGAGGVTPLALTTGNFFHLTNVKAEVGSIATPFIPDPQAVSFTKCARYYQKIGANYTWGIFGTGETVSAGVAYVSIPGMLPQRGTPTLRYSGIFYTSGGSGNSITSLDVPVNNLPALQGHAMSVGISGGGIPLGSGGAIGANNSNTAFIEFDAEI